MIYMPIDLFTPFIEGREYGIDRNWNDLNQSNKVEAGWLGNDAQQLKNWFTQDTYGDNLATSNANARVRQNAALGSDLQSQIAVAGQPGAVSSAQSLSEYQTALANASRGNIPTIANNQALYQLGQSADNAARGQAAVQYSPQIRGAQAGNQLTTAQNNAQVLQGQGALFPLQQQVAEQNLQTQQQMLQRAQDGTLFPAQNSASVTTVNPLFPAQGQPGVAAPAAAPGAPLQMATQLDPVQIYNVANRLQPGQTVNLSGVQAGRDQQGVFYVQNGVKQYINPNTRTSATATTNSLFTFGSK